MSDDEFKTLVENSKSVGDICEKISARKGGQIFTNIRHRIDAMKLVTDHFIDRRVGKYSCGHVSKEDFLNRLNNNEPMDPQWMKRKIIEFELIPYKCCKCNLPNIWNGEPLVLHLDHIDGDYMNNLLSNFRFLCPNCHSQTPTFSMGKRKKREYACKECGNETSGYSNLCPKCASLKRESIKRIGRG